MIDKLRLRGYKSLLDVSLDVGKLNVLVGPNGSGKSSVIQVLLLVRQSTVEDEIQLLRLTGPLFEAGTAGDILHPSAEDQIQLSISDKSRSFDLCFKIFAEDADGAKRRYIPLIRLPPTEWETDEEQEPDEKSEPDEESEIYELRAEDVPWDLGTYASVIYLSAERVGPRTVYMIPGPETVPMVGPIGTRGEYTTAMLQDAKQDVTLLSGWNEGIASRIAQGVHELDNIDLLEDLTNSGGRVDLLCNLMLRWILPGAEFSTDVHDDIDIAVLRFLQDPEGTGASIRPTHAGFGYSYALHVIAAGLVLSDNDILLVENPEAHLHPFSQSRIGAFLALIASLGRQIFVETHSDHVINGIRLAVKLGVISPGDVVINSFARDLETSTTTVTRVRANAKGRLDNWPPGFFSQLALDLARL